MLKINAPFREKSEVLPLIEAGADELYCGYLAPHWKRRFTDLEFERKGGTRSNFEDVQELKEAVRIAHTKNARVYLAINGLYVVNQYKMLERVIKEVASIELDGFIVADIGLLLLLGKLGFQKKLHISTGGTVFNSAACHFYKQFGPSRIILDRQTTFASMAALCNDHPDIEFEVFILNTLCVYIDGFCTFMHAYDIKKERDIPPPPKASPKEGTDLYFSYDCRSRADACRLPYAVEIYDSGLKKRLRHAKAKPAFFKQALDCNECGACALYEIAKAGISSVKIVGRQYDPDKRLSDTRFIRRALEMLRQSPDIAKCDFLARVQDLYRKQYEYDRPCRGNNCYFPEVLFT